MTTELPKTIEEIAIVGTKVQVAEWLQKDLAQGYALVAVEPAKDVHQQIELKRLRVKPPEVK